MKKAPVHKVRKPTSSVTRRLRARITAAAKARVEVGATTGTPFVVYPYTSVLQSNMEVARARRGGAQVSARANPNGLQVDTSGQAPAALELAKGEGADRVTQAMHLLSLEQTANTAAATALPTDAELETLQNPQAGLNEAIQTALGALHKIMVAREMLKSGGLQTPVYVDDGVTDSGDEASAGLKYGQTASGRAVDCAYKQAVEGVQSAMTQLVWVKQWLDDERSKTLATIVRHGHGF